MMMRTAFLLCLLCMGQAAAAPFAEEDAVRASESASSVPAPSATVSAMTTASPTSSFPPNATSSSDSEESSKGLEEGKSVLVGIGGFIIIIIVFGMMQGCQHQNTQETQEGTLWDNFMIMLETWHAYLYAVTVTCAHETGTKIVCFLSAVLSFVLAAEGLHAGSGTMLGVALLFFTLSAGLISSKNQCERLDFSQIAKLLLILYHFLMLIFFLIAAPAMYLVSGQDGAGIIILMILGAVLGGKAEYTVVKLYKAEQAGGGSTYSSVS